MLIRTFLAIVHTLNGTNQLPLREAAVCVVVTSSIGCESNICVVLLDGLCNSYVT